MLFTNFIQTVMASANFNNLRNIAGMFGCKSGVNNSITTRQFLRGKTYKKVNIMSESMIGFSSTLFKMVYHFNIYKALLKPFNLTK